MTSFPVRELQATSDDPELYPELLSLQFTGGHRRSAQLPLVNASISPANSDGRIMDLLNALARLAIFQPKQVAAVAAATESPSTPETGNCKATIYITYDRDLHQTQQNKVTSHIRSLFSKMEQILIPAGTDESPSLGSLSSESSELKVIESMLREVCTFSKSVLVSSIGKRGEAILWACKQLISGPISKNFTAEEIEEIKQIFEVLVFVVDEVNRDKMPISGILGFLHNQYQSWIEKGLTPRTKGHDELEAADDDDDDDENMVEESVPPGNLLAKVEIVMREHGTYLPVEKWIRNVLSLRTSCLKLVRLRRSRHLRGLMEGSFDVQILPAMRPSYNLLTIDLSNDAIEQILKAIRADLREVNGISLQGVSRERPVEEFRLRMQAKLDQTNNRRPIPRRDPKTCKATHRNPYVHCELSLVYHIHRDALPVYGYIGVSKLSCALCQCYLDLYSSKFVDQALQVQGSHNKFYPGWVFPEFHGEDASIRVQLVERLRKALAEHLAKFIRHEQQQSNSTTASDTSSIDVTFEDERLVEKAFREHMRLLSL